MAIRVLLPRTQCKTINSTERVGRHRVCGAGYINPLTVPRLILTKSLQIRQSPLHHPRYCSGPPCYEAACPPWPLSRDTAWGFHSAHIIKHDMCPYIHSIISHTRTHTQKHTHTHTHKHEHTYTTHIHTYTHARTHTRTHPHTQERVACVHTGAGQMYVRVVYMLWERRGPGADANHRTSGSSSSPISCSSRR